MADLRHLETAEIAKLLSDGGVAAETCRHLAELCAVCGERLAELEALMKRFRHWDAETVWREGPAADLLFEALLEKGKNLDGWTSLVESDAEYQTWGVAWVALEGAHKLIAEDATRAQARDLALLAAKIAAHLASSYHPDSIADLKALAHATAAAAAPPGADSIDTLRQVAATVTALDEGTGDPVVAGEVMGFLAQVFRKAAE